LHLFGSAESELGESPQIVNNPRYTREKFMNQSDLEDVSISRRRCISDTICELKPIGASPQNTTKIRRVHGQFNPYGLIRADGYIELKPIQRIIDIVNVRADLFDDSLRDCELFFACEFPMSSNTSDACAHIS
jgi:hypothetical protein